MPVTAEQDLRPELKAKHRAMWALGDYARVADNLILELGTTLVDALAISDGDHVLDVAAGTGNAAIPAALRGAHVVASDLTPALLEQARAAGAAGGAVLEWREADAEALPFDDGAFDVTMSCVGVMFAPHHQRSADELVRVTRAGGRIGVLSWTPAGFVGQMLATMKPYLPPPPAGVSPPPLWGQEAHVRELFGDRVEDVEVGTRTVRIERFATAEDFREFFKASYGPTIAVYRGIAEDPEKVAELDAGLAALARDADLGGGAMEWEYLLLTCRRS